MILDQRPVNAALSHRTVRRYGVFNNNAVAASLFVQRSKVGGEPFGKHGKCKYRGVNRSGFRSGMGIKRGVNIDSGVNIGDPHQHANPFWRAFAVLDLIKIARRIVVDGGPGKMAQILYRNAWRGRRAGRDARQLCIGFGWKIGMETLGGHFTPCRGG